MTEYRSPYRRGADRGLPFGVYLTVLFFVMVGSQRWGFLSLVMMVMIVAVPFIIYRFLRSTYVEERGLSSLSSLWMQGIMTFGCGAIISALAAYIYMRFLDPSFILRNARSAIEIYNGMDNENSRAVARGLEVLIENNALPTPIQVAVQSIWGAVLSGSLLSLLMGLLVRARRPSGEKPNENQNNS
ncbi:MAG: DUF4199 domain-containing protein [Clostridium sp.]|nr:DUF4199 domain-containing protein [Clostridium sp.]